MTPDQTPDPTKPDILLKATFDRPAIVKYKWCSLIPASLFIIIRNVLLSFQGFFITLPYCFLNSEVCTMIKRHWDAWRDTNNIGLGPNSARNSIAMQGMYNVCDNIARKRSSHGYHTVTTFTNIEDRRGTQDTDLSNLSCKARKTSGSPVRVSGPAKVCRPMDGPLVPQPDLVQHSNLRAASQQT